MIARSIKNRLQKSLAQRSAVVLLGARQIGKTTLAQTIARHHQALYLDLEAPKDLLKLNDASSFLERHTGQLVILDEIQRYPNLFNILRGLIDRNRARGHRSGQFLLLGSASMDLLRQSSESLAGRISYIEMSGFNPLEVPDTSNDLRQLWMRGGFPESFLSANDEQAIDWLEDFIRTYLERDVPQLGFHIPANTLRRLWTMLAHLQGQTINTSKLAANLEVQRATVNHYLDVLIDLLLVRRLQPWHTNVKKRLVKSPRYFIRDSGIQHCLLGINHHDALLSHPVLGQSWEGFVIENIHAVLPRHSETYFYRTAAGAEIDLVIKLPSGDIWAIEIKYGVAPKINKHFSQTCEDVGAQQKYVVYGGDDEFPIGDITVISLRKLLQKLQD